MEKGENKRGISPIIATILLISMAMILALIIFSWARGFFEERVQKFDQDVTFACDDIFFTAEAVKSENSVFLTNKGNVHIYAVELRKKGLGSVESVQVLDDGTLGKGESKILDVNFDELGINEGDELIVVPIVLGEKGDSKKSFVCDEQFGEEIVVKSG